MPENIANVSVIIPVFNGEDYVEQAIKSVMMQTVQPHEIIVVDDCSTDSTLKILEKYKGKIAVVKHEVNSGIGAARRTGSHAATGDYITFLSHDDFWEPNFIETMLEAARNNPTAIHYSDYHVVNEAGLRQYTFQAIGFKYHEDFCIRCWEAARQNTMFTNFSCLFIPSIVFKKVEFDPEKRYGEDLLFLLQSMKHFRWVHVPIPLLNYRTHQKMSTQTNLKELLTINQNTLEQSRKYWGQLPHPNPNGLRMGLVGGDSRGNS